MRSLVVSLVVLAGACSSPAEPASEQRLAQGVVISKVSLYQAVEAPLGQASAPQLPLVAGRPALLRVFVEPQPGWEPRPLAAELALAGFGVSRAQQSVVAASTDADRSSTFGFELPAEALSEPTSFHVSLLEVESGRGAASGARFPARADQALPMASAGDGLDIVIVPYRYAADGSDRLPALPPARLDELERRVFDLFPTREVRIRVRDPATWAGAIDSTGDGWGAWLADLLALRASDGAAPDEYYFGVAVPAPNLGAYCPDGCNVGLSPAAVDPADDYPRGAVGLGFEDGAGNTDLPNVLAHELGHLHGRAHAPCPAAAPNPDEAYPYDGGQLGSWGYSLSQGLLIDPGASARDLMGYCQPYWVSDYTYAGLFRWAEQVEAASASSGAAARWSVVPIDAGGRGARSRDVVLRATPAARGVRAQLVDGAGAPAGTVPGRYYPFDHQPAGLLLVRSELVVGRLLSPTPLGVP